MKKRYIKPEIEIIHVDTNKHVLMAHSEIEVTENIGANNYFFDTEEDDDKTPKLDF